MIPRFKEVWRKGGPPSDPGEEGDSHYTKLPDNGWIESPTSQVSSDKDGSSMLEACFNSTNMLMGVGILSLPFALAEAGWLGLILIGAFSLITLYTGILIYYCQNQIRHQNAPWSGGSYPDIGEGNDLFRIPFHILTPHVRSCLR